MKSVSTYIEIKKRKASHTIVNALEYILMLIIILEFNTILLEIKNASNYLSIFAWFVCGLLLCIGKGKKYFDPLLLFLLIGAIPPFLNIYHGTQLSYLKTFVFTLPVFFLYQSTRRINTISELFSPLLKFSNIVSVFAIVSIFYWFFATNLGMIQPTMMVPNDWAEFRFIPTYHFLYYETQEVTFMGYKTMRNSGFFEEGPMYNMVLCTALAVEFFLRPTISWKRIFLLALTIVTTFTTTGFIFISLILGVVLYRMVGKKNVLLKVFIIPFVFISLLSVSSLLVGDKQESGQSSLNARTRDIEECIMIGLKNPIFGQGLFTEKLQEDEGGTYGFSNSLFTLFADGGLYTVSIYVLSYAIIPFVHILKRRRLKWPFFLLSYFLLFSFTITMYNLLTMWILSLGLVLHRSRIGN